MIWVAGQVVPDDALKISVLDRTFEHGLGLFETFRTWNGHPTLLCRHLERMIGSARALGVPLDPAALPDAEAVAALLRADGRAGDAVLRITLSGGLSGTAGSVLWMRSAPLPPPAPPGGAGVVPSSLRIDPSDSLARHKTLNYWARRLAYEEARAAGADEALLTGTGPFADLALEGSRTNLFVILDETLVTLGDDAPILPGVMRSLVLDRAEGLGLQVDEREWRPFRAGGVPAEWIPLGTAEEVFLTNSVRGIVPVGRVGEVRYAAPGPWTRRLWEDVRLWLESGGPRP